MAVPSVHQAILQHLDDAGVVYRHLEHAATTTSQASADLRGEPLEIGGKSLLLKAGGEFRLLVLSAALRAGSKELRRALGVRRIRFATAEELQELTGLVPGCVPPFGRPILPLPLLVDRSTLTQERIAFNPGSLTHSIVLATRDWRSVVDIERVVDVGTGA